MCNTWKDSAGLIMNYPPILRRLDGMPFEFSVDLLVADPPSDAPLPSDGHAPGPIDDDIAELLGTDHPSLEAAEHSLRHKVGLLIVESGGRLTPTPADPLNSRVICLDLRPANSAVHRSTDGGDTAVDTYHYSYVVQCARSRCIMNPRPFRVQQGSVYPNEKYIDRVLLDAGDTGWTWAQLKAVSASRASSPCRREDSNDEDDEPDELEQDFAATMRRLERSPSLASNRSSIGRRAFTSQKDALLLESIVTLQEDESYQSELHIYAITGPTYWRKAHSSLPDALRQHPPNSLWTRLVKFIIPRLLEFRDMVSPSVLRKVAGMVNVGLPLTRQSRSSRGDIGEFASPSMEAETESPMINSSQGPSNSYHKESSTRSTRAPQTRPTGGSINANAIQPPSPSSPLTPSRSTRTHSTRPTPGSPKTNSAQTPSISSPETPSTRCTGAPSTRSTPRSESDVLQVPLTSSPQTPSGISNRVRSTRSNRESPKTNYVQTHPTSSPKLRSNAPGPSAEDGVRSAQEQPADSQITIDRDTPETEQSPFLLPQKRLRTAEAVVAALEISSSSDDDGVQYVLHPALQKTGKKRLVATAPSPRVVSQEDNTQRFNVAAVAPRRMNSGAAGSSYRNARSRRDREERGSRSPYTRDEDYDMLRFFEQCPRRVEQTRGRAVWQEMERTFNGRRTWQSLKNRFLRTIVPNLASYDQLQPEFLDAISQRHADIV